MYEKIDDKHNSNDELKSIIENYIILIKTMIMAKAIMMYTSEVIKKSGKYYRTRKARW